MTFPIFAALAILVVVALYLRKNRPRQLVVPFALLFESGKKEGRLARLAPRLLHPLSLLLQLVVVGLFLRLGRPAKAPEASARTHVVLLDVSEETARRDASGTSGLAIAMRRAGDFVRSLPEGDEVHIVALSGAPHVLWSGSGGSSDASRGIEARVEFGEPNLREALSLARELGSKTPTVYLLSPRRAASLARLEAADEKALLVLPAHFPAFDPKRELSLRAFGARRAPNDPGRFEALVRVDHRSGEPLPIEVVLSSVDVRGTKRAFFSETRVLGSESSEELRFPSLEAEDDSLIVTVKRKDGGSDGLADDEIGYATIEERARLGVEVRGKASAFLEAALSLDPFVRIAEKDEAKSVTIVAGADFYPNELERPTLFFGEPPKDGRLLHAKAKLENFGIDNWKEHPIFTDVDPYDIQILRGASLALEREDRALADSSGAPIVTRGIRNGFPFLAIGFLPEESDFVLRAAYPIFVHNALRFLADRNSSLPRGFETNRLARIKVESGYEGEAHLDGPLGDSPERWSVRAKAGFVETTVARPGLYAVEAGDERKVVAFRRAPRNEMNRSDPPTPLESATETRPFESSSRVMLLLALALLALLSFEWWSYHRRITA